MSEQNKVPTPMADEVFEAAKRTSEAEKENSLLQDRLDLMVDEFLRIKALVERTSEIAGLCERAISDIKQIVPMIEQRDDLQSKLATAERERDEFKAMLLKEREALSRFLVPYRDSIPKIWLKSFENSGSVYFDAIGFVYPQTVPPTAQPFLT